MDVETRFKQFHKDNPGVYNRFVKTAFELIDKCIELDINYLSSDLVGHVMRVDSWRKIEGEDFKVNNSYISYFARMFNDEYGNFFVTRETKTEKAELMHP